LIVDHPHRTVSFAPAFLAEAFFILAPSFLNVDELPARLHASVQPIVEVDPAVVSDIFRTELKPFSEPQIIHSFQFVDQLDDALHCVPPLTRHRLGGPPSPRPVLFHCVRQSQLQLNNGGLFVVQAKKLRRTADSPSWFEPFSLSVIHRYGAISIGDLKKGPNLLRQRPSLFVAYWAAKS
jgi:hypothetical protein